MDERNDSYKTPQENPQEEALKNDTGESGTQDGFRGFDSAVSADSEHSDSYTVTPNGGYYNDKNAESSAFENSESADSDAQANTGAHAQENAEPSQTGNAESYTPNFTIKQSNSYFPNGSYGNPSSGSQPNGGYSYNNANNGYSGATGGYQGYNGYGGTVPPSYHPTKPPKAPKPPKPKKAAKAHSFGIGSLIAVALVAAVLTTGCFWGLTTLSKKNDGANSTASKTSSTGNSTTEKVVNITGSIEQLAETAAEKASSSVVGIGTTYAVRSFFSGESTSSGSGSGVIYKSDGYIITNYHVIADALTAQNSSIMVYLDNDTKNGYKASVINYNISCDLAVLKIDKTGLTAIEIGDSDQLKIGQYVVAIGSPGGLEFMGSTTFGIVSGLNRQISTTNGSMNLIQTDAAINPGNSGGALVDTEGKLVGISSSKLVNESYEGMGFAIPVNKVVSICDDLIAHEGEGNPYTGISVSTNYTSEVLKYYGYPSGAVVAGVDSGSPAETAGLKRGDIITKFGDTEITEPTDYDTALSNYYPKDTVKVTYYRSGQTKTATLTIGSGK